MRPIDVDLDAHSGLQDRLAKLLHRLSQLETRLGGRWDLRKDRFQPAEATIAMHARDNRIVSLPWSSLVFLRITYYPLIFLLGGVYSFMLADIQGWEGVARWLGQMAIALAFTGGALLATFLWKKLAMSRYRHPDKAFRRFRWLAVGTTASILAIDYATSYLLFSSAFEAFSLGGSDAPGLVVVLMAGLTTFGQALAAFLGYASGIREEVCTSLWSTLVRSQSAELDELKTLTMEVQQLRDHVEAYSRLPAGHVDRTVNGKVPEGVR